jgi:hypothetical protein
VPLKLLVKGAPATDIDLKLETDRVSKFESAAILPDPILI